MDTQRIIGDKVPGRIPQWMREVGAEVYSTCTSFRYPRNGNVYNPTPVLFWIGTYGGKIVSKGSTLRSVREGVAAHIRDEQARSEQFSRDSAFGHSPE